MQVGMTAEMGFQPQETEAVTPDPHRGYYPYGTSGPPPPDPWLYVIPAATDATPHWASVSNRTPNLYR